MHINELVLEITRRCNIQCLHCLRGKAQAKDMDNLTMQKALEGITSIGTITFTGGEPTLAVDRIRYFIEYLHTTDIYLGSFYVVTNGKIASRSLHKALLELSYLCHNMGIGGLVMSQDNFHKELGYNQYPALDLYEDLEFFQPEARKGKIEYPINEGWAFENGLGKRSADVNDILIGVQEDGSLDCSEGTVYINALGDVIPSCDLSYHSHALEKIGNVHDKPLVDILSQLIVEAA